MIVLGFVEAQLKLYLKETHYETKIHYFEKR